MPSDAKPTDHEAPESWDEDPTHVEPGNPLADAHPTVPGMPVIDERFDEEPTSAGVPVLEEAAGGETTNVDELGGTRSPSHDGDAEAHSPPGDYPTPSDDTTVA